MNSTYAGNRKNTRICEQNSSEKNARLPPFSRPLRLLHEDNISSVDLQKLEELNSILDSGKTIGLAADVFEGGVAIPKLEGVYEGGVSKMTRPVDIRNSDFAKMCFPSKVLDNPVFWYWTVRL